MTQRLLTGLSALSLAAAALGCSASHTPDVGAEPEALVVGEWSQRSSGCGPDYTTYLAFAADGSLVMRGVMTDFDDARTQTEVERVEGTWSLDGGVLTWSYPSGDGVYEQRRAFAVLNAAAFGAESGGAWWSHAALARVDGAYVQHDWSGQRRLTFDRALDAPGACRVSVQLDAETREGASGTQRFELGCEVVESERRPGLRTVQLDVDGAPSAEGVDPSLASAFGSLRPAASYTLDPAQTHVLVPEYATPEYDGFIRLP